MRQLAQEMKFFIQHKFYIIAIALTAVCGYGYVITHPTIGIDDTAMDIYLHDGIMVEMGRWVMYLINKVFYFGEFAPFLTDLIGVLFLMIAATLFCVFLRRILGERMGIVPCTLFSCLFVSNPIIYTVYVYYFHNGIGIGYMLTALALIAYESSLRKKSKSKAIALTCSTICIWIAIGCYESFLIVYIMGILLCVFLYGMTDKVKLTAKYVIVNLLNGVGVVMGSMILRTIILPIVIAIFHIDAPDTVLGLRSVSEMFVLFRQDGLQELIMLIKRYWLVYHVNAFVYLPVTGYNLACVCVGIYSVIVLFKKKNVWYPILFIGMVFTPFLLTLIEAKVTFYRTCQYLPFFTAVGVVMLYLAFGNAKIQRYWRYAVAVFGAVLVYNQATELNYNFYMDYQEYEHEKEILIEAVYDVQSQYGSEVPIVFTGSYDIPYEFVEHFYVGYDSWQYKCIAAITDVVDEHLKEKYFQPEGYCFIGERNLPMIRGGFDAFDGTNGELVQFLKMHGYSITTITDAVVMENARSIGKTMPVWPREGSITMQDGYVLVNL